MKPSVTSSSLRSISAEELGSAAFKKSYGVQYAYYSGSMYRGIASKELVIRMGKAKLLSFLGTGGLSLERMAHDINEVRLALGNEAAFGANIVYQPDDPASEMQIIELFLEKEVSCIEASAFMEVTAPLVLYRLKGLSENSQGEIQVKNKLIAKISRPETANAFMNPAPEHLINKLLSERKISELQARLSERIAMCDDICTEADSGGHTDQGVATVLLPTIRLLRDNILASRIVVTPLRVGMAGGLGSPEAIAAAFIMGADFVCTGSINQCTVESGMSDFVKDLLQNINIQDTDYAPAGDMFEIGALVQVLKKGTFFPTRANKLFVLYNHYNSLEEIPESIQKQVQDKYFKKSFNEIYEETREYFNQIGRGYEIERAERDSKHKMALVFRWYFGHSMHLAFEGDAINKIDYQVHTGPALGAFNQWVKGSPLENWRNRHVDEIAHKLMQGSAAIINTYLSKFF